MNLASLRRPLLSLAILLAPLSSARAQFWPGGHWPGYGNPYGGPGGVVAAQAEGIRAVGQLGIDQEQARIQREAANQAKLETQKKAFDQMLYERSLKPTFAEDITYEQNRIVSRMMSSPQPAEIVAGRTLNAFLPYIMKLAEIGVQGPPVPVNQGALARINVSTGPGGPRIGVLRQLPLAWPMALRGPLQQKLDPMLQSAVSAATTGALQPGPFKDVRSLVNLIEEDFLKRFRAEEVSTSDFLVATRFLDSLKPAVQALGDPAVSRLLDGSYAARGSNVPELSSNMSFNGLTFAPGNPGSDAAYRSLHDSFVGYIRTAQAASGFQPRMRPPDPLAAKR